MSGSLIDECYSYYGTVREFVLGGCVGKSATYSDCVKTLDKNWRTLEEEGALALITGNLGGAPSCVAGEL